MELDAETIRMLVRGPRKILAAAVLAAAPGMEFWILAGMFCQAMKFDGNRSVWKQLDRIAALRNSDTDPVIIEKAKDVIRPFAGAAD